MALHMKRFLLLFLLAIVLACVALSFWWNTVSRPANPKDTTSHDFLVVRGQSLGQVAYNLEKQGLVKNRLAFKLYAQIFGQSGKIQAGEYGISPSNSLEKIMLILVSGPKELWVTYPEGLRREETALKTIKTLGMDSQRAQTFWVEFMTRSDGKEGYLFPETYLFGKDVSATSVVNKLSGTFEIKLTDRMRQDAKESSLSLPELVTLASIVERETRTDDERPTVAGILTKRLSARMPLQVDATLQYIATNKRCGVSYEKAASCSWWDIPTANDRAIVSAYNTYSNAGLPPGPIANPSLSSLSAVIYPQDSPYWFYIHDSDGQIHYAKTGEEHAQNINKYLR